MKKNDLDKIVRIGLLIDIYGELLTDKQRQFVTMHYDEDMSFQEIAEVAGVTRQAVFDAVKNAEDTFEKLESKLNLIERLKGAEEGEKAETKRPTLSENDTQMENTAGLAKNSADSKADIKKDLIELKSKIVKQGVIYNTKWIENDLINIIEKL